MNLDMPPIYDGRYPANGLFPPDGGEVPDFGMLEEWIFF